MQVHLYINIIIMHTYEYLEAVVSVADFFVVITILNK